MILLLFFQVEKKKLTSECQGAIVSKTPAVATCDLRKSFRYVTWHLGLFPIAPEEKKKQKQTRRKFWTKSLCRWEFSNISLIFLMFIIFMNMNKIVNVNLGLVWSWCAWAKRNSNQVLVIVLHIAFRLFYTQKLQQLNSYCSKTWFGHIYFSLGRQFSRTLLPAGITNAAIKLIFIHWNKYLYNVASKQGSFGKILIIDA